MYGKLEEPDGLAGLLRLRTGGPRLQDQARTRAAAMDSLHSRGAASGKKMHLSQVLLLQARSCSCQTSTLL